jgi:hypothetical protein
MVRRRPNTMPRITSTRMIAIKSQMKPGIARSMGDLLRETRYEAFFPDQSDCKHSKQPGWVGGW